MNFKEFQKETDKTISILNKSFEGNQRYDISSKIYLADLYDDFNFIKNNIDSNNDLKILDIGCGKGHLTALLSVFLNKKIDAIDLVDSFGEGGKYNVETLGSKWQEAGWNEFKKNYNVDYSFYDGKRLPFESNLFDVLVAYAVLEHVDDEDFFLRECNRVLKKGGKLFIFRCPTRMSLTENIAQVFKLPHHDRRYSKKRLKKLFQGNNFDIKKIGRYDTFPAFIPKEKYQEIWNKLFFINDFFRVLLKLPPFYIFAHHFRALIIKK
jgi:2-polyprenyl-3-methyl-5-hydroxy-6-metoxy-1,4-benzoquinol methylase